MALVVEGVSRFKLEKIIKEKPYRVGQVTEYKDEGKACYLFM